METKKSPFKLNLQNKRDSYAFFLCLTSLLSYFFLLIYKYFNFGYYDWDLAFFAQAMWSLLHGSQYTSLVGINFFGDHSYYFAFFLLPFYAIFPHPLTLILFKVLAFNASALIIYYLAKKELGAITAIFFMILYLIFPANVFGLLYDFNLESLAPPFLLLMFYFFKQEKGRAFALAAFFAILTKENMLLILMALGIYALFTKRKNKLAWSLIPILGGATLLYILAVVVIPFFRELPTHAFVVRYHHLGNSIGEILVNILIHPLKTLGIILEPTKVNFIQELFGPLLIPSLLSPHILLLISPILAQHLLSAHPPEHSIYYHYGLTFVPFIFLAAINTFKLCKSRTRPVIYRIFVTAILLLCVLNTVKYTSAFLVRLNYHRDHMTPTRWEMVRQIPKNAAVIATFDFLAELSSRQSLYSFHKIYDPFYQDPEKIKYSELNTQKSFALPEDVRFALIDFDDPWLKGSMETNAAQITSRIRDFLLYNDWSVTLAFNDIVLFEKNASQPLALIERLSRLDSPHKTPLNILIDQAVLLSAFEVENPGSDKPLRVPFVFDWRCVQKTDDRYSMLFTVKKDKKIIAHHLRDIGYAIFPTVTWQAGDNFRERYWLFIPYRGSGEYTIEISFVNYTKRKLVSFTAGDSNEESNLLTQTLVIK